MVLLDNVQFIYELALAQLELQSFGARFALADGFRQFRLLEAKDDDELRRRLAYFKSVNGALTHYFHIIRKNRTRSLNQYLTHWIYPYKGKFHPQMIRALLNIIGLSPGETLLDPFAGSGTAAVEAQLLGINCIGFDISPLCVLQSRVKTESVLAYDEILSASEEVMSAVGASLLDSQLRVARDVIDSMDEGPVRNFYEMVELVSISDRARRRRDFGSSFVKNLERMLASVGDYRSVAESLGLKLGDVNIVRGDARSLDLPDASIDGIITSPPYSIALDYLANDAHALEHLGYAAADLRPRFMGLRGRGEAKLALYNEDLKRSLAEMFRVLRRDGYAAIVVGNATYSGQEVKTIDSVTRFAQEIGFRLEKDVPKIIFGLYNVMQSEHILIFRKAS
ncbi:MAG TPA: DNA methyltransferase [bacterium]|nr:DNA methyltransferase [bacterium]